MSTSEPNHAILWKRVTKALGERGALAHGGPEEIGAYARTVLGSDIVERFVREYYLERKFGGRTGRLSEAAAEQLVRNLEALPRSVEKQGSLKGGAPANVVSSEAPPAPLGEFRPVPHDGEEFEAQGVPTQLYFAVSVPKLIVMSLCTIFVYELYWFYKNWRLVKEREHSNIIPAARAWFTPFFCYSLFCKIRQTARESDITTTPPAGPLAIGYVLSIVLSRLPELPAAFSILAFSGVFFLIPIQIAVNRINAKMAPTFDRNARFSVWNIATIVFGIMVIFGLEAPSHAREW